MTFCVRQCPKCTTPGAAGMWPVPGRDGFAPSRLKGVRGSPLPAWCKAVAARNGPYSCSARLGALRTWRDAKGCQKVVKNGERSKALGPLVCLGLHESKALTRMQPSPLLSHRMVPISIRQGQWGILDSICSKLDPPGVGPVLSARWVQWWVRFCPPPNCNDCEIVTPK